MSKEQKTLKSCYILDRLREWFELYGNQNHQRAEEELHLAIDELYEYQQKYQKITDLEAKLAESEEKINMLEQHKFYADNIIQAYADKCKQYEKQIAELTHQHEDK